MPKRKLVTLDWAMKRLLKSKADFVILEGFLSELLFDDIQISEVLESESNKDGEQDKYNRVDIKVTNSRQEIIIIIEIQFDSEYDYFQRILYGAAKVITEHMKQGYDYHINHSMSDPLTMQTEQTSQSLIPQISAADFPQWNETPPGHWGSG